MPTDVPSERGEEDRRESSRKREPNTRPPHHSEYIA